MIRIRLGVLLAAGLLALCATSARANEQPETTQPAQKPRVVFVEAAGVKSGGQAVAVARAIRNVGVKELKWTKPRKELRLVRVSGSADEKDLLKAPMPKGVKITIVAAETKVFVFAKKLHCNGCFNRISKGLKEAAGVKEFEIAKDWKGVTVTFDTRTSSVAKIQKVLKDQGYPATVG